MKSLSELKQNLMSNKSFDYQELSENQQKQIKGGADFSTLEECQRLCSGSDGVDYPDPFLTFPGEVIMCVEVTGGYNCEHFS